MKSLVCFAHLWCFIRTFNRYIISFNFSSLNMKCPILCFADWFLPIARLPWGITLTLRKFQSFFLQITILAIWLPNSKMKLLHCAVHSVPCATALTHCTALYRVHYITLTRVLFIYRVRKAKQNIRVFWNCG